MNEARWDRARLEVDHVVGEHVLAKLAVRVEPLAKQPIAHSVFDWAYVGDCHARSARLERHHVAYAELCGLIGGSCQHMSPVGKHLIGPVDSGSLRSQAEDEIRQSPRHASINENPQS